MNKRRKMAIEKIISELERVRDELWELGEEERIAFENLPESLQSSARGELLEENADALEEKHDELDILISDLNDILEENY